MYTTTNDTGIILSDKTYLHVVPPAGTRHDKGFLVYL